MLRRVLVLAFLAALAAGTAVGWPATVQAGQVMATGSTVGGPSPPPLPNV
jgi:hypothetical protein